MAKKRKIKIENNESDQLQNQAVAVEEQFSSDEIESIKNYEPLHLSFKTHIILAVSLFILFSLLFLGYLKIVSYYAQQRIDEGLVYLQVAEKLNKEDTGILHLYQESEEYQLINKLHLNMSRDLSNMFQIIKDKHLKAEYVEMFKETRELLPEVVKIIEKRAQENFNEIELSAILKKYSEVSGNMFSEFDELFKLNDIITGSNDYDKYRNRLKKNLDAVRALYFDMENRTLRLRGLWNRAAAFDASLELFQRAINIDNKNTQAYYNLAKMYDLMNEPELAGERYIMVIKLEPKSELASKVFEQLKKAAADEPENMQNRYNLGMAYLRLKQEPRAKEEFDFIISKDAQLKSYLAFMADKRLKEMNNKTPEVIYDPRI